MLKRSFFLLSVLALAGCGSMSHPVQAGGNQPSSASARSAMDAGKALFDLATTKCQADYIWSLDNQHTRFERYTLTTEPDPVDNRVGVFEGVLWRGTVKISFTHKIKFSNGSKDWTVDQPGGAEWYLLNRGGQWYYSPGGQSGRLLIAIGDMRHVQDDCDVAER